jgi:thiol-disulfide isomerase/thioredoxin
MKRIKKTVLAICLGLLISGTATAGSGINFQKLTLKEGLEKAEKENKKVFIDIYATWCAPCKYLSANVFTDQELGNFMNENFISLKLDGEKTDGLALMGEFNLNSYPTMLFLSPEKEMLKKIVGGVSATTIKKGGKDVLFPEQTAIFKLEKRYKKGDREKDFLLDYISELKSEGRDPIEVVKLFLKSNSNLSLENEKEFLVFALGVSEMQDPNMKKFLANAEKYAQLHGDIAGEKMGDVLMELVDRAVKRKDSQIIVKELDTLFKPYKAVFGSDSFKKDKLTEILIDMYKDKV